jgi:uncharacterized protein YjcR
MASNGVEARRKGEGMTELTLSDAIKIRCMYRTGASVKFMAEMYSVTPQTIRNIIRRKTHSTAHITKSLGHHRLKVRAGKGEGWK